MVSGKKLGERLGVVVGIGALLVLVGCGKVSRDTAPFAADSGTEPAIASYVLGGNVDGLNGTLLLANGADQIELTQDGPFTFGERVLDGASYAVTVSEPPSGESCEVLAGTGTIRGADVNNVRIECRAIKIHPVAPALVDLRVDPGTLLPAFEPQLSEYRAEYDFFQTSVEVTAVATDPDALLQIAGMPALSGFPLTVAIASGTTIVDVTVSNASGTERHYELELERDDRLVQETHVAPNRGKDDWFGVSARIDGDTIVVGAQDEDSNATGVNGDGSDDSAPRSGAAYVLVRSDGQWQQEAYLKASNAATGNEFGVSVDVDGDTVVVGARNEHSESQGINGDQTQSDSHYQSGAVYVFVRDAGSWRQQAYLKASNAGYSDMFGASVVIRGDTLVVGAPHEGSSATTINGDQNDDSVINRGAAYVFERSGESWAQTAYLKASTPGEGAEFGSSLALDRDTLVVGAHSEGPWDSNAPRGAVYVFVREGIDWLEQAHFTQPSEGQPDNWCQFGASVAIDGDRIAVGAPNCSDPARSMDPDLLAHAGTVSLFNRAAGNWTRAQILTASNPETNDGFGYSVALRGTNLAVGAVWESGGPASDGQLDDDSAPSSGAVYLFSLTAQWSQSDYLKAADASQMDTFGWALDLDDSALVVTSLVDGIDAPGADHGAYPHSGALYVFEAP